MTGASPTRCRSCNISCGETMQSLAEDLAGDLGDRLCPNDAGDTDRTSARGAACRRRQAARSRPSARSWSRCRRSTAAKLAFRPALAASLAKALGVWQSGAVIKVLVRYPTAFWRDKGLSGMVMWRDLHGLFACDASKDDDHPALVVFIGGPLALRWRELGDAGLRAEVTARLDGSARRRGGRDAGSQLSRLDCTIAGAAAPTATSLSIRRRRDAEADLLARRAGRCISPRRNCRRHFRAMSKVRSLPGASRRERASSLIGSFNPPSPPARSGS